MCFFRKKPADARAADKTLIDKNEKSIEALKVLAEDNEPLLTELNELQEQLRYLTNSEKSEVKKRDERISNLIGDLKIALTKNDGESSKKADNLLRQIKLEIAERNALM